MLCTALTLVFGVYSLFAIENVDPLPSWHEGTAKAAIIDFVHMTTAKDSPKFVPLEERIATFDQDGTLWVEQPMYTQVIYCLARLPAVLAAYPELKQAEPFKGLLADGVGALAKLSMSDLEALAKVTLTGMPIEQYQYEVHKWLTEARDMRWKSLYTELKYKPMMEVLEFMRANGYKTYIATGGGQDFVRVFAGSTYGIPKEQVIGTAGGVKYGYENDGRPFLTKEPTLILNDDFAGKVEGIHLMVGRRPLAAFGNSTGDREMLEYTKSGGGLRLAMLVLHDDAEREYAYGPAEGLPESKVGTFTQALYDEAKQKNWLVVSMKKDWKQIFDAKIQSRN